MSVTASSSSSDLKLTASPGMTAHADEAGRLVLPPELAARLGLRAGAEVAVERERYGFRIKRPLSHLAKVYVEPTTRCNLSCRTCIRNSWEEVHGLMSEETFARLLDGLAAFEPVPAILFGGFGEPLTHPGIVRMVRQAKALGAARVELVTNGCLLDEKMSRELIAAGLGTLWVSLDGVRPESYEDVRLGAVLPQVLENLRIFREVRRRMCEVADLPRPYELPGAGLARNLLVKYVELEGYLNGLLRNLRREDLPSEGGRRVADFVPGVAGSWGMRDRGETSQKSARPLALESGSVSEPPPAMSLLPPPELGITFVAIRRNIADLPFVLWIGRILGASRFNISNVLPYTAEMEEEILYRRSLRVSPFPTLWSEVLNIPPLDVDAETERPLRAVLHGYHESALIGGDVSGITGWCPFIEGGTTSVSWRGEVSPCQALLYTHTEYVLGRERLVERHLVGHLGERSLKDIWLDKNYVEFRRRVQGFDFAPCLACGICRSAQGNQEDCEDDIPPRCGACLWAQGLIRCP